jgi:hypothetical protein
VCIKPRCHSLLLLLLLHAGSTSTVDNDTCRPQIIIVRSAVTLYWCPVDGYLVVVRVVEI